jgi:hypothetical protein
MGYEDLKKSLYQAFRKALGSKQGLAQAANHIAQDINDSNMTVDTPSNEVPVAKESVLHKDISPAEIHQQKQAQAEAKLGMVPKAPSMKKKGYGSVMTNGSEGMAGPEKGVRKLKQFIENLSIKKTQKISKRLK